LTKEDLIHCFPLLFAAYTIITTFLYIDAAGRLAAHRAGLLVHAHLIWQMMLILPGLLLVRWYASALGIHSGNGFFAAFVFPGDAFLQMIGLIVLGFVIPVYGVFGFVAVNCPARWQRYNALKAAIQQTASATRP
jgi:hypothetical protein